MIPRSFLFVPGDKPDLFDKALNSAADAIILDLEDSVAPDNKHEARRLVADFSTADHAKPLLVRVNPFGSGSCRLDLEMVLPARPDAIVLPKASGAYCIQKMLVQMGPLSVPILPIATETPRAIFELGGYSAVSEHLYGLTWGAEDLPAAIGAKTARDENGALTTPYQTVRSLALFAAHAAQTLAIETVYPNFKDLDGLKTYAQAGCRDGFVGMMAIHPAQCDVINTAFTPSEDEIAHARAIVDAFANAKGSRRCVLARPDARCSSPEKRTPYLAKGRKPLVFILT